jgi:hypothetical protein
MTAIGWLIAIIGLGIVIMAIQHKDIAGTFASFFSPITSTAKTITK